MQKTYELYQAAVVEQAGIDKLVELLETDEDMQGVDVAEQSGWRCDSEDSTGKNRVGVGNEMRQISINEEDHAKKEHTKKEMKALVTIKEKLKEKVSNLRTLHAPPKQEFIFEPEEELVVEHPTVYLGGPEAVKTIAEACSGRLTHQGANEEKDFFIGETPMVIGSRYGDADIRIEADGVSRIHAIVGKNSEGEYYVEDLNSINGTYVNGEQLAYHQQCILHKNDEIILATEVFHFS